MAKIALAKPNFKLPKIAMLIAVTVILILSIGLRMLPLGNVITDNTVQLKGADAYYFVRQAQNMNAGGLGETDPMLCYPAGFEYDKGAALYPVLLSIAGKVMPLEMATAIMSPLLALVFLVFVYLLLKELLPENDWAVLTGLAVAGMTGIQFISRSYFGFGDRHVLEIALFTAGLWALIKAWNSGLKKYGIITGIIFLLYSYSWSQASLILAILTGGILLTYVFKKELPKNFTLNNALALGIPALHGLIFQDVQTLGISVAAVLVIFFADFITKKLKLWWQKLLAVLGFLAIGVAIVYFVFPALREQLIYVIGGFLGLTTNGPIVSEAQPMFTIYNNLTFPPNAVTIQVVIFAFALLGNWSLIQHKQYLLAFLSIVLALVSLQRIRTEYYFVLAAAYGVAYLVTETKKFAYIILALVLFFFYTYATAWYGDLQNNVSSLAFTSSDYKMAAWMKENLPDSGIKSAGVYTLEEKPNYGVMNDWQIGYLYSYLANKPMVAEPNFCNANVTVDFLLQTDENVAYAMAKAQGVKYVLVKSMDVNKYFYYLAQLGRQGEFASVYGTVDKTKYLFIDPLFYQRLGTRMYNFNGDAYTPSSLFTISADKQLKEFTSYETASATNPKTYYSIETSKSPIPLEKLQHFKLIQSFTDDNGGVKLFEVVD